jgi:hypothetical protein
MGLDMYAYVAAKAGQHEAFYEDGRFDPELKEFVNPKVKKPREICYWRKHPNLHGWMEQLWIEKSDARNEDFNGVELELTWEDLERLERDILAGFFFGSDSDDYYREQDLKFIKDAKAELFCGLKVFYNSSW